MRALVIGGAAWLSILQFFVAEEIARLGSVLPYSRSVNLISDLGATGCGPYQDRQVCSPDHLLINISFVLVGVAIVVGAGLIGSGAGELGSRPTVILYVLAGVGAAMVGLFPEDTVRPLHAVGAGAFFVGANAGHFLLGRRLRRHGAATLRPYGRALAFVGALGLIATVFFVAEVDLGVGAGLVERIVVYAGDVGFIATGLAIVVAAVRAGHTRDRRPAQGAA